MDLNGPEMQCIHESMAAVMHEKSYELFRQCMINRGYDSLPQKAPPDLKAMPEPQPESES